MINFFRKIRHKLMVKGKFSRYAAYAVGEIALVVIGILIALQINNWNDTRIENNKIKSYFKKINEEVKSTTQMIDYNQSFTKDSMIPQIRKGLQIMSIKQMDSIVEFKKALNYLTESESLAFYFPIIDEFLDQGYLSKIDNSELNRYFEYLDYIRSQCNISDEITRNYQYQLIKPYIQKNINYSEIALFKESVVEGGSRTDFTLLLDDIELWNLLTFQLENLENSSNNFQQLSSILKRIDEKFVELKQNY